MVSSDGPISDEEIVALASILGRSTSTPYEHIIAFARALLAREGERVAKAVARHSHAEEGCEVGDDCEEQIVRRLLGAKEAK